MILLAALLAAADARTAIGIYHSWGAFRDGSRCYAIAAPIRAGAANRARPFASIASRFGRDRRAAVFIRLSTPRGSNAPVTLAIGERRFTLSASATAAWAADAATDRAVVAAMRGARSMSVSTVAVNGRPFADTYALTGAATAIDAAALGCAR
ncbi:invasion associated locus B family protein [Sphingomonas sp. SUN019]|uniref:invasion associated locus B family protein n=1 Tax=Sphingomonas sp. SUN019 TaxID=2937788 RepID=UPI002164D65A|nr:invasion associated locus B family protein [Sphingomonas sp. SUN019]UVO51756.1 invasion associated locus B family protein [Sphingomonas sp. SUN019]